MKQRIRVRDVEPGMFSTERYVAFEANGRTYSLFVDADSLRGKTLEVDVLSQDEDNVLIELPREPINAATRLRVPKDLLAV